MKRLIYILERKLNKSMEVLIRWKEDKMKRPIPKEIYIIWESDGDDEFPIAHCSLDDFNENIEVEVYKFFGKQKVTVTRLLEEI